MFHVEQFGSKGSCAARLLNQAGQFYRNDPFILGLYESTVGILSDLVPGCAERALSRDFPGERPFRNQDTVLSALFLSVWNDIVKCGIRDAAG